MMQREKERLTYHKDDTRSLSSDTSKTERKRNVIVPFVVTSLGKGSEVMFKLGRKGEEENQVTGMKQ